MEFKILTGTAREVETELNELKNIVSFHGMSVVGDTLTVIIQIQV